jgi:Asp-tRNA(Asn)/Glu-tRNA(Gln) amidotransferase A subunit family amidase
MGMVPFALGTQTKGSVLRPASYCGVTGFKPTFGWCSTAGVLPVARSLDTIGFFTDTPADMRALWAALRCAEAGAGDCVVGVPAMPLAVEPPMAAAFDRAVTRLERAGVVTRPVDIGDLLTRLGAAAHTVMFYEGARVHRERYGEHGDRLGDLADLVRAGLRITEPRYDEALEAIEIGRRQLAAHYTQTPVIAVPAATGPAPHGLESTGDPAMNAPWTALGTPAIAIPLPVGRALPLGLQLTAAHGEEALVLRMAERIASILADGAVE